MTRQLHETVVVRVSVVGIADEGIGSETVSINLDEVDSPVVGNMLAKAFRRALKSAVLEFAPKLKDGWIGQPDRFRDGDP